ncbi:hypothetical protein KKC17_04560 [Patescibacteria group bacterium]|nr:hypothetical protein [Patescibacteria group bacterium]
MFDDSINLLPENKRDLEKEERLKNKTVPSKPMEFSQPDKVKKNLSDSLVIKKASQFSWWKKVTNWFRRSAAISASQLENKPLKNPSLIKEIRPETIHKEGADPKVSKLPVERDLNIISDVKLKPNINDVKSEPFEDKVFNKSKLLANLPEVNLIPSEEQGRSITRAKSIIWSSSLVAVVLVLVGSGFLFYYRNSLKNESLLEQDRLIVLQDNLEGLRFQAEESLFFQTKIQAIGAILNKRGSWAPLFEFLEKNTVVDVFFTGFAGDSGGRITLAGLAPDYTQVAKQFKVFASNKSVEQVEVINLRIQKVGDEITNVSFSFIIVAPDFFTPASVSVK